MNEERERYMKQLQDLLEYATLRDLRGLVIFTRALLGREATA